MSYVTAITSAAAALWIARRQSSSWSVSLGLAACRSIQDSRKGYSSKNAQSATRRLSTQEYSTCPHLWMHHYIQLEPPTWTLRPEMKTQKFGALERPTSVNKEWSISLPV